MNELFHNFVDPWLLFFAKDPLLLSVQLGLIALVALLIFLIFFATRDILLRTHSFWYTLASVVLVACLPVVGFLIYLLIRPTQTLVQREIYDWVKSQTQKAAKESKAAKEEHVSKDAKIAKDGIKK